MCVAKRARKATFPATEHHVLDDKDSSVCVCVCVCVCVNNLPIIVT